MGRKVTVPTLDVISHQERHRILKEIIGFIIVDLTREGRSALESEHGNIPVNVAIKGSRIAWHEKVDRHDGMIVANLSHQIDHTALMIAAEVEDHWQMRNPERCNEES